jgi:calpain-7
MLQHCQMSLTSFSFRDDFAPNDSWLRVFKAFNFGDVLVTLGTGSLSRVEEKELGLASSHNYAVLDMKESEGRRLMLVKNPWSEATKGNAYDSVKSWSKDLDIDVKGVVEDTSSTKQLDFLAPGTFWMDFNNLMRHFAFIYLNWNPSLFAYRQDHHFAWDLTEDDASLESFSSNPQFSITNNGATPVWLLLSRHFRTGDDRPPILSGTTAEEKNDCLNLYIFENGGYTAFLRSGALHQGSYISSPQTMLPFQMPKGKTFTVVVAQQAFQPGSYSFTLSAFSRKQLEISRAVAKYNEQSILNGAWANGTAGGNTDSSAYPQNPQFSLRLPKGGDTVLLLETSHSDLLVNIRVFWGNGKRVTQVTTRDILGDSGEYRRSCALLELHAVDAGVYTIVCSTFAPGQTGNFRLKIYSTDDCHVSPIPSEAAGRLSTLRPATFTPGVNRLLAPIMPQRLTKFLAIARPSLNPRMPRVYSQSSFPMKLSIEYGQGPNKDIAAVSGDGDFIDSPMGVRTGDLDLDTHVHIRGGIWLVIERLGGGIQGSEQLESVDVEILTDNHISVGEWGIGSG